MFGLFPLKASAIAYTIREIRDGSVVTWRRRLLIWTVA
jgi:hypothetical protein